jgi:hypothetical protein
MIVGSNVEIPVLLIEFSPVGAALEITSTMDEDNAEKSDPVDESNKGVEEMPPVESESLNSALLESESISLDEEEKDESGSTSLDDEKSTNAKEEENKSVTLGLPLSPLLLNKEENDGCQLLDSAAPVDDEDDDGVNEICEHAKLV